MKCILRMRNSKVFSKLEEISAKICLASSILVPITYLIKDKVDERHLAAAGIILTVPALIVIYSLASGRFAYR